MHHDKCGDGTAIEIKPLVREARIHSLYIENMSKSKILEMKSQMSLRILLLAIRLHPICLSKCVRNYRQFQKHALAPTLGALALFTLGKYRSETWLCTEANLAAAGE